MPLETVFMTPDTPPGSTGDSSRELPVMSAPEIPVSVISYTPRGSMGFLSSGSSNCSPGSVGCSEQALTNRARGTAANSTGARRRSIREFDTVTFGVKGDETLDERKPERPRRSEGEAGGNLTRGASAAGSEGFSRAPGRDEYSTASRKILQTLSGFCQLIGRFLLRGNQLTRREPAPRRQKTRRAALSAFPLR